MGTKGSLNIRIAAEWGRGSCPYCVREIFPFALRGKLRIAFLDDPSGKTALIWSPLGVGEVRLAIFRRTA